MQRHALCHNNRDLGYVVTMMQTELLWSRKSVGVLWLKLRTRFLWSEKLSYGEMWGTFVPPFEASVHRWDSCDLKSFYKENGRDVFPSWLKHHVHTLLFSGRREHSSRLNYQCRPDLRGRPKSSLAMMKQHIKTRKSIV